MKTYTYKSKPYETGLQVGEPVNIGDKRVVVLTIFEVDFDNGTVQFFGMNVSEIINAESV